MATGLSDQFVSWKKLVFLLALSYTAFMVVLYQGHFSFQDLFSSPSTTERNAPKDGIIQNSLRYLIHTNSQQFNETESSVIFDIHLEHPILGHTGEVLNANGKDHAKSELASIAIGGGLTSRKMTGVTEENIPRKFLVFTTLLPSFCKTASKNFQYHFYFAYDKNDKFFMNPKMLAAFQKHFTAHSSRLCKRLSVPLHLHFVQCSHAGSPAWAQNDAMMEAYIDGIEFFYRINDDSQIESLGWTESFIKTLASYDPKYVGVVGPKHSGGNMNILTYDFVHRTHINIFGFYYPRFFRTWWADDWVTKVYQPGRSTKLSNILLKHTMKLGQRYKVDYSVVKHVQHQIDEDKKTLQRYIKARTVKDPPEVDPSKVISFSLYGKNPDYTMGTIRNAQLMPVFYPGWTMRVYLPSPGNMSDPDLLVPPRIANCLRLLGVDLAYVNSTQSRLPPKYWKYLVADDEQVELFLIRDARARFSDREAQAVKDWLKSNTPFHCMHDHPNHKSHAIIEGLWGAQVRPLKSLLKSNMISILLQNEDDPLHNIIEPIVQNVMYCHDSISCDKLPGSHPFPTARVDREYVGNRYDRHQQVLDKKQMALVNSQPKCLETQASDKALPVAQNTTAVRKIPSKKLSSSSSVEVKPATLINTLLIVPSSAVGNYSSVAHINTTHVSH